MLPNLDLKYLSEKLDPSGHVESVDFSIPDDFNFAFDVVDEIARLEPDRRALIWIGDDLKEKVFTFSDISEYSKQCALAFAAHGIQRGTKVLLMLKRHVEAWFAILACHRLGAVAIPATDMLQTHDIVYRIQSADITAAVCTPDGNVTRFVDEAESICKKKLVKFVAHCSDRDNWIDLSSEMDKCKNLNYSFTRGHILDPMLMYFTSGTNGMPKIVEHNYAYPIGHIATAKYWHQVDPDGLHMTVAESGWGKFVWGNLYGQWFMGAGVFAYDFNKFNASSLLSLISSYRISTFCAPPTIYRFLIKEDLDQYDLSSIKHATIAGEPLNPEVLDKFKKQTGLTIHEGFGMTETTCTIMNPYWSVPKPGSTGKPSPAYTVALLNEDGKEVSPGVTGEIAIKLPENGKILPGLFNRYYGDPEKTNEVKQGGWFHTGDTAWMDEDGRIWYIGRNDDLIKSSGYRIGPFEVESVLMEHPAVLECAVTPYPDAIRGTIVKATILLAKGYSPSDELAKEIQQYVKSHTAPYKYPRRIEFVDSLPKTVSGKINHKQITKSDFEKAQANT